MISKVTISILLISNCLCSMSSGHPSVEITFQNFSINATTTKRFQNVTQISKFIVENNSDFFKRTVHTEN